MYHQVCSVIITRDYFHICVTLFLVKNSIFSTALQDICSEICVQISAITSVALGGSTGCYQTPAQNWSGNPDRIGVFLDYTASPASQGSFQNSAQNKNLENTARQLQQNQAPDKGKSNLLCSTHYSLL